jgi:hypothetical protein
MKRHSTDTAITLSGYEAVEFLDIPTMSETRHSVATPGWAQAPTPHLNEPARTNIARQAYEYISWLVREHDGDDADIRSVVLELRSDADAVGS